jgi:hypothetical protein
LEPGQCASSHIDLSDGEEAGHEELFAELDLEDVDAGGRVAAPAEADLADRRRTPVELLEPSTHTTTAPREELG